MCGTCKIVNFSWLLFSTLVIGQNLLTQKNTLLKWSVNAFCCVNGLHLARFMHPLCKNENIPMWGKHRYRITIPGSLLRAFEKMNNKLIMKVRGQILHVLSVTTE